MLQKKISMLGGFAFGKTSLVKRYVESVFSETYLTTVGVKIDKKTVDLGDHAVSLIPSDVAGEDDISSLRMSYLQGRAGYVLVADGTRLSTLEVAPSLRERIEADHGHWPFELLLNKSDRQEQWAIGKAEVHDLLQAGWSVRSSSARIGEGGEDAFRDLAVRVAAGQ
jgi:GTPase SAR1 family protein